MPAKGSYLKEGEEKKLPFWGGEDRLNGRTQLGKARGSRRKKKKTRKAKEIPILRIRRKPGSQKKGGKGEDLPCEPERGPAQQRA